MEQNLSEELIKDQYELYNRLKNEIRKKLLIFIYEQPRNYKELAEFSELKPGSLYHHLGVLEPLIDKFDHGQYKITDLGKKIIESLEMVSSENQKPTVQTDNFGPSDEIDENLTRPTVQLENDILQVEYEDTKQDDHISTGSTGQNNQFESISDRILQLIWLSPICYILLILSVLVSILLGLQGVAFAGSAIYAVGSSNAFLIDLLALFLGIGSLLILEDLLQRYPVYDRFKFVTIIRIISMLPSLVIGITLLLLFFTGIIPPADVYPYIFAIGILMGTSAMITGVYYLRGQSFNDAILYSIVPTSIDLLIGVVIILSV